MSNIKTIDSLFITKNLKSKQIVGGWGRKKTNRMNEKK